MDIELDVWEVVDRYTDNGEIVNIEECDKEVHCNWDRFIRNCRWVFRKRVIQLFDIAKKYEGG